MIGDEVTESVIFVTTKWAREDSDARDDQEDRFEQWKTEIEATFRGASIVRLDGKTSRRSTRKLAQMTHQEQEQEAAKYHENTLQVFREIFKREAKDMPLLQRELHFRGRDITISDTQMGRVITNQLLKVARESKARGFDEAAQQHENDVIALSLIPVHSRMGIEDARKHAQTMGVKSRQEIFARILHASSKIPTSSRPNRPESPKITTCDDILPEQPGLTAPSYSTSRQLSRISQDVTSKPSEVASNTTLSRPVVARRYMYHCF
ncbi:hypothetical protein DL96DRAFT_1581024 [Flagelloscypha sp. PMI_526]|nr:hypothetical protein DL96DRAFT_1581024 [Flagelloscypha sp. PMI_526]